MTTLTNKVYILELLDFSNEISKLRLNETSLPIPCVDKSIPQKCIGFVYNSNFTINWNKLNEAVTIIVITGDFNFFDDKEYEFIGFEVNNESCGLASLIFKEKGELM